MKIAKVLTMRLKAGSNVDKLLAFLNTQPNDEVFSTADLREKLNFTLDGQGFRGQRHRLKEYETKIILNGRLSSVWGNKTAIVKLKKGIADENRKDNA
jgi:hypothetical protein